MGGRYESNSTSRRQSFGSGGEKKLEEDNQKAKIFIVNGYYFCHLDFDFPVCSAVGMDHGFSKLQALAADYATGMGGRFLRKFSRIPFYGR